MKEDSPVRLTVICYTYNHVGFIRETLSNFVSQKTDFRFKVIVHDDASTDGTTEIIKEMAAKYPDIICPIYQKQNQYQTIGIVRMFEKYVQPHLEGDYAAFCEGDDHWCDDNKLQKQFTFLEQHPSYTACVHNTYVHDMKTGKKTLINETDKTDRDMTMEDVINGTAYKFHTTSLVYRMPYLLQRHTQPYFEPIDVDDYPTAIYLAATGKIHYLADIMSVYRFRSTPAAWSSHNTGWIQIKARVSNLQKEIEMLQIVKDMYPQYVQLADKTIMQKEYDKLFISGNRKEIGQNAAFREIYQAEPPVRKLKFYIRKFALLFCHG